MTDLVTVICGEDTYKTLSTTLRKVEYFKNVKGGDTVTVDRNPYLFQKVIKYLRNPHINISENDYPEFNYYLSGKESEDHDYLSINVGGKKICILRSILKKIPYFEGLLRCEWKDSDNLFLDQDPEVLEHIFEYIQDNSYQIPREFIPFLDYFGLQLEIITDKLEPGNPALGKVLEATFIDSENENSDRSIMGAFISMATNSHPYYRSLPSKYIKSELENVYVEITNIIKYIDTNNQTERRTHRMRIGRICDVIKKFYIKIPYCTASNSNIPYPYSVIKDISITSSGTVLYKRSGHNIYHYDLLYSNDMLKLYWKDMYEKQRDCYIVLDLSVLHNSLYLPQVSIYDLQLQIETNIDIFPLEVTIDGVFLNNTERTALIQPFKRWTNTWTSHEIPITSNDINAHINQNKLVYRIIYCAIDNSGDVIPIEKFSIFFNNQLYYSEDEHKIQLRMMGRDLPIIKGIYEWFVEPSGGFNSDRIDDINFQFVLPQECISPKGTIYCHIQTLDLLAYQRGSVGFPYI